MLTGKVSSNFLRVVKWQCNAGLPSLLSLLTAQLIRFTKHVSVTAQLNTMDSDEWCLCLCQLCVNTVVPWSTDTLCWQTWRWWIHDCIIRCSRLLVSISCRFWDFKMLLCYTSDSSERLDLGLCRNICTEFLLYLWSAYFCCRMCSLLTFHNSMMRERS